MKKDSYVYIDKLAYDFGLFDLPKEEQTNIIEELNKIFEERLFSKILDLMNDADKELFVKTVETGNEEDVMNFIIENISNLPKVMDSVYLDLRKELLADVNI